MGSGSCQLPLLGAGWKSKQKVQQDACAQCKGGPGQGTTEQTVELHSRTGTKSLILSGTGQEGEHSCEPEGHVSKFGQPPRKGAGQLGGRHLETQ